MDIVLEDHIEPLLLEMKALRKQLHSCPELGFEETKTVEIISNTLRSFDLKIESEVGKTEIGRAHV